MKKKKMNMITDTDLFRDKVVNEGFEVLRKIFEGRIEWPNTFTIEKKLEVINKMISYYEEDEQYERCAYLLQIKNEVTNDVANTN